MRIDTNGDLSVGREVLSGLKYLHVVKRSGMPVDRMEEMIGSYPPRTEPYTKRFAPNTAPSGFLARSGTNTVRSRIIDDDGQTYADFTWSFKVRIQHSRSRGLYHSLSLPSPEGVRGSQSELDYKHEQTYIHIHWLMDSTKKMHIYIDEYVCTGNPADMFLRRFRSGLVMSNLRQHTARHDLSVFLSLSLPLSISISNHKCPHVRVD